MWPIQLAFLLFVVCRKLLSSFVLHIHAHKFYITILSFRHGVRGGGVRSGAWSTVGKWKEGHPTTAHKGPEGGRGIALLFLELWR
jgi:hypothetical protein